MIFIRYLYLFLILQMRLKSATETVDDNKELLLSNSPDIRATRNSTSSQFSDKDVTINTTDDQDTSIFYETDNELEEALDKVEDTLHEAQSGVDRLGYGVIQQQLQRVEDRHRRLSNCMSPHIMADGEEEGKIKSRSSQDISE